MLQDLQLRTEVQKRYLENCLKPSFMAACPEAESYSPFDHLSRGLRGYLRQGTRHLTLSLGRDSCLTAGSCTKERLAAFLHRPGAGRCPLERSGATPQSSRKLGLSRSPPCNQPSRRSPRRLEHENASVLLVEAGSAVLRELPGSARAAGAGEIDCATLSSAHREALPDLWSNLNKVAKNAWHPLGTWLATEVM